MGTFWKQLWLPWNVGSDCTHIWVIGCGFFTYGISIISIFFGCGDAERGERAHLSLKFSNSGFFFLVLKFSAENFFTKIRFACVIRNFLFFFFNYYFISFSSVATQSCLNYL